MDADSLEEAEVQCLWAFSTRCSILSDLSSTIRLPGPFPANFTSKSAHASVCAGTESAFMASLPSQLRRKHLPLKVLNRTIMRVPKRASVSATERS